MSFHAVRHIVWFPAQRTTIVCLHGALGLKDVVKFRLGYNWLKVCRRDSAAVQSECLAATTSLRAKVVHLCLKTGSGGVEAKA